MRDKNLNDDSLKLVAYRILFVKRDYEAVLDEGSGLVHDNLTPEGFVAGKIAEFSQNLSEVVVPESWGGHGGDRPRYPSGASRKQINGVDRWVINAFDEDDNKYLRVSYEVLERSVRQRFRFEEDQVEVLRRIRDAIAGLPGGAAGAGRPSGSPASGAGQAPGGGGPGWVVS